MIKLMLAIIVSILCIISKIFERVVYDQFESYLNDKKLLYKFNLVSEEDFQLTLASYIYQIISSLKWIKVTS